MFSSSDATVLACAAPPLRGRLFPCLSHPAEHRETSHRILTALCVVNQRILESLKIQHYRLGESRALPSVSSVNLPSVSFSELLLDPPHAGL